MYPAVFFGQIDCNGNVMRITNAQRTGAMLNCLSSRGLSVADSKIPVAVSILLVRALGHRPWTWSTTRHIPDKECRSGHKCNNQWTRGFWMVSWESGGEYVNSLKRKTNKKLKKEWSFLLNSITPLLLPAGVNWLRRSRLSVDLDFNKLKTCLVSFRASLYTSILWKSNFILRFLRVNVWTGVQGRRTMMPCFYPHPSLPHSSPEQTKKAAFQRFFLFAERGTGFELWERVGLRILGFDLKSKSVNLLIGNEFLR